MSVRRMAIPVVALGLLVALALVFISRGEHTLRAAFDEAVQVVPGQEVRIAGRPAGQVKSISELDGDAIVELGIDDDDWPLHRGTVARLRYGSISGYAARFVELTPGPASAPQLPSDGVLNTASTVTPVEFDQIFNSFDGPTRRDLRGVLDQAADSFDGHSKGLAGALREGPGGLEGYANFAQDLAASPEALRLLLRAGAETTATLRGEDPALRALLEHAAGTVDELASRASAQQATLERLPATLRAGQGTLGRLDSSLVGLRGLVADLAPGAEELRSIAPTVGRTTRRLAEVAPLATSTLKVGRRAAPSIDRLLVKGREFLPRASSAVDRLAPMLACIRPYAPEIVGTATTWTGFSGSDAEGGYGRVDLTQLPPTVAAGSALNSKQVTGLFKDRVFYAMPRPPGLDAGQPWFLPECGAGPDALDASKDPELGGGG